jgi:hypothetical protein
LGLYQSQMYQEEPFKDITSPTLNKHNKGENNISSLASNFGLLSKPSSILQPFQSSYLIATPNIQDKSAMTGALVVSPFNLKQDPLDKENRVILMSEDPKYKHPTSYAAS